MEHSNVNNEDKEKKDNSQEKETEEEKKKELTDSRIQLNKFLLYGGIGGGIGLAVGLAVRRRALLFGIIGFLAGGYLGTNVHKINKTMKDTKKKFENMKK